MIEWIKYDPMNPPEKNIEFLVWSEDDSCGSNLPWLARFNGVFWSNSQSDGSIENVTFYAKINSPIPTRGGNNMTPNMYEEDEQKVVEAYKKHGHTITEDQAGDIWSEYSHVEFFASWMMMGNDLDVIYNQTLKHAKTLGIVTEDDNHVI